MRAWGNLAENYLIVLNKEFHPEHAPTAQRVGNFAGILTGLGYGSLGHGVRLPGFAVVAIHLNMTNGIAKGGAPGMPDGELGDLVIKINKAFDYDLALPCPATCLGIFPGFGYIVRTFNGALPLPDELMMGLTTQGIPISSTA